MFVLDYGGTRWEYRVPSPFAALLLAALPSKKAEERTEAVYAYVEHVLLPESLDRMWERAFDVEDPFDLEDVAGLIEEIQGANSSRPFHVDVSLATSAVAHWPSIRGRLVLSGVADPLRDLPNVYALLDVVEGMILEGMKDEAERERYWIKMYAPPKGSLAAKRTPKGWSREEELAGFSEWES